MSAQQCQCQNCKKDLQASVDIDVDLNDAWNLRGENGSSNSILEAVKETAEKTLLANLGFVFDPGTKLYCNYSTGYYYDPVSDKRNGKVKLGNLYIYYCFCFYL